MSLLVDIMAGFFLIGGGFFLVVAGVGVVKFPDAYCRAHVLGKAMTLGIIFLTIAMGLLLDDVPWAKVAAYVGFQLATIPVASHLLCLAAYRRKIRRWTVRGWVTD